MICLHTPRLESYIGILVYTLSLYNVQGITCTTKPMQQLKPLTAKYIFSKCAHVLSSLRRNRANDIPAGEIMELNSECVRITFLILLTFFYIRHIISLWCNVSPSKFNHCTGAQYWYLRDFHIIFWICRYVLYVVFLWLRYEIISNHKEWEHNLRVKLFYCNFW